MNFRMSCPTQDRISTPMRKTGKSYGRTQADLFGPRSTLPTGQCGDERHQAGGRGEVPQESSLRLRLQPFHNETTEGFCDIVLPESHYLETLDITSAFGVTYNYPVGLDKVELSPAHARV